MCPNLILIRSMAFVGITCFFNVAGSARDVSNLESTPSSFQYSWKRDIVATCFWVGEGASGYNNTTNYCSAWDKDWTSNYGGTDSPVDRSKFGVAPVSVPKNFAPTRNPFYIALPFNDVKYPDIARKVIPWWSEAEYRKDPKRSQCQGRWIAIEHGSRICYAQWEDVGPLRFDHYTYVFGNDRPTTEHSHAGLDVSPAVRDYLKLTGIDKVNWRFAESSEVPDGPWIKCAEQAILFASIKGRTGAVHLE